MELTPLTPADIPDVLPWFDDAESRRRLGGYYPPAAQLRRVIDEAHRHGWIARAGGVPVALLELERTGNREGYALVLVAPAARRRGYGKVAAARLVDLARGLKLRRLLAYVAADATGSQRCFRYAGFRAGAAEDGFIPFRYDLEAG